MNNDPDYPWFLERRKPDVTDRVRYAVWKNVVGYLKKKRFAEFHDDWFYAMAERLRVHPVAVFRALAWLCDQGYLERGKCRKGDFRTLRFGKNKKAPSAPKQVVQREKQAGLPVLSKYEN